MEISLPTREQAYFTRAHLIFAHYLEMSGKKEEADVDKYSNKFPKNQSH